MCFPGLFIPGGSLTGKKLVYVAYQNLGYDIMIKDMTGATYYDDNKMPDTKYSREEFSPSYFDLKNSVFTGYKPRLGSDWFMIGCRNHHYGIAGFMQMSFSDNMGDHQVVLTGNYIRQDSSNDLNFDAAYYYLKNRLDLGIGAYSQTNPYLIYSIADINNLIHNVNFGTVSMRQYGGYAVASYPFNRFFRADLKGSVARYEYDYTVSDGRPDVYANLNQVDFSLCYDNVLWGGMVPADGTRGQVSFRHAFNITGQDFTFSSFDIDVRRYFLVSKRYVFAFRGVYGKIFGPDSESFNYYLGGYNTLRGHPFLEYSGTNMFLFNSEFRFTAVEGIKLGWPLPLSIGSIGGVLFMDAGSVWGGDDEISDTGTDGFTDVKTDMGFGFRFVFYPVIILKLDFAWPFDRTSFGNMDIIFSIGFEY
jgi:outer membrane protein assembly factor BamA